MKNNVKTYLGFAVKKGSVIYGLDAMERQNKAPYAVLLCPTAAQNTAKKTAEYCKARHVRLLRCDEPLAPVVYKTNCKVLAVTDQGLAQAILKNTDDITEAEV